MDQRLSNDSNEVCLGKVTHENIYHKVYKEDHGLIEHYINLTLTPLQKLIHRF